MTHSPLTAVVTGGSSGMGLGLVKAFLERGYNVVANSRTIDAKQLAAQGVGPSPRLALVPGDISRPETAQAIAAKAADAFGSLDILVNNAGVFVPKPFTEYTPKDLEGLFATNLHGFFHLTQVAIDRMLNQGGGGSIVNITASIAEQPLGNVPAALPILTKGGLNAVTRGLALEYASRSIRVNAVSPGIIETPMHAPESHGFLHGLQPVGKMGRVQDVVEAVLYLVSAPFVTGEILHVDGGMTTGRW